MPFLRFSRDKRGYEHTYLVQATNRRGKSVRPRVLYWYRTPPGVQVGRQPFDDGVKGALEAQNPGIAFDWPTITSTPFPPLQEPEPWRERRRAEKAARQLRREEEQESTDVDAAGPEAPEDSPPADLPDSETSTDPVDVPAMEATPGPEAAGGAPISTVLRRRRRRGGRNRRSGSTTPEGQPSADPNGPEPTPSGPPPESSEGQE